MTARPSAKTFVDPDLRLLREDPPRFFLHYQDTIRIIVRKYVNSGMFRFQDFEDIVQTVNADLWTRLPRIQANYDGRALVRTYISAIIRNICLKLREKHEFVIQDDQHPGEEAFKADPLPDRYSVLQAKSVFRAVLLQFYTQSPRILICLKARFHIPLTGEDVLRWHPECSPDQVMELVKTFGGDYTKLRIKEIHALLTPILNTVERKRNTVDALRKWTDAKLREITDLLNSSLPGASFDEESVGILLEDYTSPFLLKE